MKFGIISDTHGSLPTAVFAVFDGVDKILHAGDIGGEHILAELEAIAPVTAVVGNCDYPGDYLTAKSTLHETFAGTRFLMAHTPNQVEQAVRGWGDIAMGAALPHICIHGHTHVPRRENIGPAMYLCPGSPTRPRGGNAPTVMLLDSQNGRVDKLQIIQI